VVVVEALVLLVVQEILVEMVDQVSLFFLFLPLYIQEQQQEAQQLQHQALILL
jgi:hypothetical protein